MNKKSRYKKLFRKVRSAHRAGTDCSEWLAQLNKLDTQIAAEDAGWRIGMHSKYIKQQKEMEVGNAKNA